MLLSYDFGIRRQAWKGPALLGRKKDDFVRELRKGLSILLDQGSEGDVTCSRKSPWDDSERGVYFKFQQHSKVQSPKNKTDEPSTDVKSPGNKTDQPSTDEIWFGKDNGNREMVPFDGSENRLFIKLAEKCK